ncbi:conjugal transfer protein TraH [Photobacterium sp. R1]
MKKQFIAITLLVTSISVKADVNGSLGSFWDGMGYSNVTYPSAYKGQSANYYTAGNLFLRTKSMTIQPLSVELPSMGVGCGGIDLFLGAFSHINSDQLVQFGKSVVSNALPFAVDLALQTWAPSIKQIRDHLQSIADKYLNQSISSCEVAQASVSGLAGFADVGSQKYICSTMGTQNNAFADWVAGQHECGAGGQGASQLKKAKSNSTLKPMVKNNLNIVWSNIMKDSYLSTDKDLAKFLMAISGTIVYDASGNPQYYSSLLAHNNNLVQSLLVGGKANVYNCSNDSPEQCIKVFVKEIVIQPEKALQNRVYKLIQSIAEKLINDQELNDEEKSFLEYTQMPILAYIRDTLKAGQSPNISAYAAAISVEHISTYLRGMLKVVQTALSNTTNDPKDIHKIETGIIDSFRYIDGLEKKAVDAIISQQELVKRHIELRRQLEGMFSTQARSNLQFGG